MSYTAMYVASILGYMEQVKELDDPVGKHLYSFCQDRSTSRMDMIHADAFVTAFSQLIEQNVIVLRDRVTRVYRDTETNQQMVSVVYWFHATGLSYKASM